MNKVITLPKSIKTLKKNEKACAPYWRKIKAFWSPVQRVGFLNNESLIGFSVRR